MADKVEHLIQQLASDNYWTRYEACKALGALGDVRAFEPLLQRLGDEDSDVRAAACEALGALGDVRAFEPLLQRLGDEEWRRSRGGVSGVGRVGRRSCL
jgi:HEAT repeat protein